MILMVPLQFLSRQRPGLTTRGVFMHPQGDTPLFSGNKQTRFLPISFDISDPIFLGIDLRPIPRGQSLSFAPLHG